MATKKTKTVEVVEAAETETILETETVVETEKPEVKNVETKPLKKKFKPTDPIVCVSITAGDLGMIGIKSHINYTWAGRGDDTEVEYQDLVAAIRSGKSHIFKPRFIIQDEDFLNEFPQVKKVYSSMYSVKDLRAVFSLTPAQMKKTINSLPDGAKESIKHIASNMISNGTLDSVAKIKVLDEIYDTKFMLMTELFNA